MIGTAGLWDLRGSEPVIATQMMQGFMVASLFVAPGGFAYGRPPGSRFYAIRNVPGSGSAAVRGGRDTSGIMSGSVRSGNWGSGRTRHPEAVALRGARGGFGLGTAGAGRYTARRTVRRRGVHESDSFISEVSEAVRRDKLYAGLRRYGWLIAALVVLLVGGAAFNEWYKVREASRSAAAGDAMKTALAGADAAARAAALGEFADATPRAAVAARLAQAGSLEAASDPAAAAAVLAEVAGDGTVPELYRSLAALQRVMLLGKAMDASERQATIEMLATPGAPFRPLALEQRALMHLEAGDKPAAIADLEAVLAEPGATQALQGRVRQLIIAAGGTLPVLPGAAPEAAPDAASVPADG